MSRQEIQALAIAREKFNSLIEIYAPMGPGQPAAIATLKEGLKEFEAAVREDTLQALGITETTPTTHLVIPSVVEPSPEEVAAALGAGMSQHEEHMKLAAKVSADINTPIGDVAMPDSVPVLFDDGDKSLGDAHTTSNDTTIVSATITEAFDTVKDFPPLGPPIEGDVVANEAPKKRSR